MKYGDKLVIRHDTYCPSDERIGAFLLLLKTKVKKVGSMLYK